MGLINIDALLNVLNQMYKKPKDSEDYMTIGYDHAIADAIITASKQPTIEAPEWISVKENMPEVGEEVLISTDTKMVFTALFNSICWEDDDGYTWNQDEVLAWMPLPEPYEYPPKDFMNQPEGSEE